MTCFLCWFGVYFWSGVSNYRITPKLDENSCSVIAHIKHFVGTPAFRNPLSLAVFSRTAMPRRASSSPALLVELPGVACCSNCCLYTAPRLNILPNSLIKENHAPNFIKFLFNTFPPRSLPFAIFCYSTAGTKSQKSNRILTFLFIFIFHYYYFAGALPSCPEAVECLVSSFHLTFPAARSKFFKKGKNSIRKKGLRDQEPSPVDSLHNRVLDTLTIRIIIKKNLRKSVVIYSTDNYATTKILHTSLECIQPRKGLKSISHSINHTYPFNFIVAVHNLATP